MIPFKSERLKDMRLLGGLFKTAFQGFFKRRRTCAANGSPVGKSTTDFRALFCQIPEIACILGGPEHIFEFANEAYIRIFGSSPNDLTLQQVFPNSTTIKAAAETVYKEGKIVTLREEQFTVQAHTRVFNLTFIPCRRENGSVHGVLVYGTEVTDQVLAREQMSGQKQALELSLQGASLALVLDALVKLAEKQSGEDAIASILLTDKEGQHFLYGAAPNLPAEYNRLTHGLPIDPNIGTCGPAAYFSKTVFTQDIANDPRWASHPEISTVYGLKSCWSTPILSHDGKALGTFALYYRSVRSPHPEDQLLVDLVTHTASLVIERHRETEQRAAFEKALRESEQQLAQAVKTSRVGFWNIELPSLRVSLSPIMAEECGIQLSTFPGTFEALTACIHPEDRAWNLKEAKRCIQKGTPYHAEYRVVRPSGEMVWIEARGETIRDTQGKPIRVTGTCINITSKVKARKRLEESAREFKALADSMPQIVWIASPDGMATYHNQKWREYTGMSAQQSLGNGWQQAIHPDDKAECFARWKNSYLHGQAHEVEYRLRRHDGAYRWHLTRASPMFNEKHEIVKWFGTNTDIHEYKLLLDQLNKAKQSAETANQTKSAFLANMSHEIRTPLNAILGFSNLLKDSNLSARDRNQYIDTIVRSGKALNRLIDDILDLSKVEANRLELENAEFSVPQLVQEAVELFREKAKSKGIQLILEFPDQASHRIASDSSRLRQILLNLIGNAVKFTQQGSIRVQVNFLPASKGRVRIQVRVQDTGIGLTREQQARLFQPFMQADNSTARRFGGTGLGLALSQRLAHALGGDITIDNQHQGPGCTFVLTFVAEMRSDVSPVLSSPATSEESQMPGKATRLSGAKILVAEDSPDNQLLALSLLTKNGASVEIASNGKEAVEKALHDPYNLILMDIQMPEVDGYEATRSLREHGYKGPIVALTAHAMNEDRARTREAGCDDHLTKPLNIEELLATAERWLGRRHPASPTMRPQRP